MNNLFLIVSILILICPNYCFGGEDSRGTAKKTNGDGQKSLKEVNGIIQMKESSNKINLECCECLCNGKVSNKEKSIHLNSKRAKRSGYGGYGGSCARCGALTYNSSYCYNCYRQHYTRECAHCTNAATGHDYHGNPACSRHDGKGNPANNDEREARSTSECSYCTNPATGWDYDGDAACSNHYHSGRKHNTDEPSSSDGQTRECAYCSNTATTKDLDGDPACLDHKFSGRSRPEECVYCTSPATAYHRITGRPVCSAHNHNYDY